MDAIDGVKVVRVLLKEVDRLKAELVIATRNGREEQVDNSVSFEINKFVSRKSEFPHGKRLSTASRESFMQQPISLPRKLVHSKSARERKITCTRMNWRQDLSDIIGPRPVDRSWRDDFLFAMQQGMHLLGENPQDHPHRNSVEDFQALHDKLGWYKSKVEAGFTEEEALCLQSMFTSPIIAAIGKAVKEYSSAHAAITHEGYSHIAKKAYEEHKAGIVAPRCFALLHGRGSGQGLADKDPRWMTLAEMRPDKKGFVGMTSFAPMFLGGPPRERHYSPQGLHQKRKKKMEVVDSDVVCFESAAAEEGGRVLHSAVRCEGKGEKAAYILPPQTLLAVVSVNEGPFEFMEGKWVNQRLITVRPTFMLPIELRDGLGLADDSVLSKFAVDHTLLQYGNARSAIANIDDITRELTLTMEEEWLRNDTWQSRGSVLSALDEWEYVRGAAEETFSGDGVGTRDEGHDGWSLDFFLETINDHVKAQATKLQIPAGKYELLTLDEVTAIRLYTGPGFVKINSFMREIYKVNDEWRRKLSQWQELTYAATVLQLTNGLRKLVKVNSSDDVVPLYRAVKGRLPQSFYTQDGFGQVTAADYAFMSTSTDEEIGKEYMNQNGPNVLWDITCSVENDTGFHNGADVQLLSQFPQENEKLFPPLTLLTVIDTTDGLHGLSEEEEEEYGFTETGDKVTFVRISVTPTFV
jgi:hypothetical protein